MWISIVMILLGGSACGWIRRRGMGREYQLAALVFTVIGILGLAASYQELQNKDGLNGNLIEKRKAGTGEAEENLKLEIQDEEGSVVYENHNYEVTVPEIFLSKAEIRQVFGEAEQEIEDTFCKDNPSLEEVYGDVLMNTVYCEGLVSATWNLEDTTYMDSTGARLNQDTFQEEGKKVLMEAQVELNCQEEKELYTFCFRLVPKEETPQEECLRKIRQKLDIQKKEEGEEIILPGQVDRYVLTWSQKHSGTPLVFLLLGCAAAVIAVMGEREEERRKKARRNALLLSAYPDLVSKLALLLGAGMSLQSAIHKILEGDRGRGKLGAVAEELEIFQREIQSGVSEYQAVINLSDRCEITEYRKLCSMITQNQRMGTRKLSQMLLQESDHAFTDRKNRAKKAGEEAGTKMLFPMMVMLLLIMVIIMIPAFITMGL